MTQCPCIYIAVNKRRVARINGSVRVRGEHEPAPLQVAAAWTIVARTTQCYSLPVTHLLYTSVSLWNLYDCHPCELVSLLGFGDVFLCFTTYLFPCLFFFFFLMIRPPPRSPLFPYTTLSR